MAGSLKNREWFWVTAHFHPFTDKTNLAGLPEKQKDQAACEKNLINR